jgi:hypothetical protein
MDRRRFIKSSLVTGSALLASQRFAARVTLPQESTVLSPIPISTNPASQAGSSGEWPPPHKLKTLPLTPQSAPRLRSGSKDSVGGGSNGASACRGNHSAR